MRHVLLLALGLGAVDPHPAMTAAPARAPDGATSRLPSLANPTRLGPGARPPTPREVEVVGLEYAFRAPTALPPGPTAFHFVNRGKVMHEMNLLLLAPGVSIDELNAVVDPDRPRDAATAMKLRRMIEATVGVLFARPGERAPATLVADLLPGRTYAIRCIVRDSASAPAHFTRGMYSVLRVTTTPRPPVASALPRADTVVAMDYAFRYPRTISPGAHALAFLNTGRQRHMAYLALLRPGVTVDGLMAYARTHRDPSVLLAPTLPVIEHSEGLLNSFAGMQSQGLLQVRFLPGRDYALLCFIADSLRAPPHIALGMYGSMHVTER